MSSQDGSNRSQRSRRTSQQRPTDAPRRQNQTWDVDPAEIDRYLSGRPSRSEDTARRTGGRGSSGQTAEQLSRLQNAVGRRPGETQPPDSTATYRTSPPRQSQRRPDPEPIDTYADDAYDEYADDIPVDMTYAGTDEGYAYEDEIWDEPEPAPRAPQRRAAAQRPSRGNRQPRRYEPDPVDYYPDDEYDEELYNDDPYLGYEDAQLDRRPPRAPRSRQQPKISKPNLPKITIPSSVSDSPLLADRLSLILIGAALLSLALMSFVVSDRINLLGDTIPTHVNASGDPENLRTRDAVWNIPLLAGMVMLMNIAASWFIARIDLFAARFLLAAGLLVHFLSWVALFKYLWE